MSADLPLSPDDVAEIVSILDRTPYDRINIHTARFSLAVVRSGEGWVQSWEWPAASSASFGAGSKPSDPMPAVADPDESEPHGLQTVRAMLPGTFYRAPQPGAPSFVEVGSRVEPDTVLGIIETMKLMTPVHAGVSGVVVAILVGNAAVVEVRAALVRIEPTAR